MHDARGATTTFHLPKQARLKDYAEFQAVFSQHKKYSNQFFRILVRYKQDQLDTRLGIIVSRRVSRKAVNRNRIKRQVREAFRQNRRNLKNVDMVVIAHRSCESATNSELYENMNKLLRRLKA